MFKKIIFFNCISLLIRYHFSLLELVCFHDTKSLRNSANFKNTDESSIVFAIDRSNIFAKIHTTLTFNRNFFVHISAAVTSIFCQLNIVRMVSGYTCICMIHDDVIVARSNKKKRVSGENIPCFNYLRFNSRLRRANS